MSANDPKRTSEDPRVLVMARVAALRFPLRDEKPCISSTGPCTSAEFFACDAISRKFYLRRVCTPAVFELSRVERRNCCTD